MALRTAESRFCGEAFRAGASMAGLHETTTSAAPLVRSAPSVLQHDDAVLQTSHVLELSWPPGSPARDGGTIRLSSVFSLFLWRVSSSRRYADAGWCRAEEECLVLYRL